MGLCKRRTEVQGDGHRVRRADQGAWTESASGGIGAKLQKGGGMWCRRPVLVFQRWMPERLPRLCMSTRLCVCEATAFGGNVIDHGRRFALSEA